jgi:dipeptidyl aminopeptidase/acylaminoacyl peptidase
LAGQSKPKLTLDDFFNSVSYPAIAISPDGNSVAIVTERADWDQQIFRHDLWLYRDQLYRDNAQGGSLIQLTQSGHDTDPQWSPDGRWIAFLSERKPPSEKNSDADDDKSKTRDKDEGKDKDRNRNKNKDKDKDDKGEVSQIYLISPTGGEAIQITQGAEEVHAFSWSADSRTLYFATRNPWTKSQKDDYKKKWKDVVQYRTAERGDTIFSLDVAPVLAHQTAAPAKEATDAETDSDVTPGARALANSPLRIDDLITSPDGAKLAFLTNAVNQRQEKFDDVELYALDLTNSSSTQTPRRLTHNQAVETHPRWASDSRHILFTVEIGDVSGPYRDLQPHLYSIDTENPDTEIPNKNPAAKNKSTPWAPDFPGSIDHFAVAADTILASARTGAEVSAYSITQPNQSLHKLNSWPGTYEQISAAKHSPRFAFIYSALQKPAEIYLADSADKLNDARPITTFNKSLSEKDLPQGKPYRWKADDGTTIEGMLIYPPGIDPDSTTPAAKNLPLFTFIHGGPADADGNHFEADWYEWSALAAANGWLVFEPNYRGSTGYGDKFLSQIVPQIVSRPGKDILEGVDALVKAGIADPSRLAVGGYSYGGYMTNWLITQTTRFKAAVTGAGAVEHLANWGNDDTTFDDAYFLGGRPWEAPKQYHDEAAIFQIDKVRTPTHIVAGADDIRVAVLEAYLLEHALYSLGIPNKLLIFPGEGHSLDKNPWHGKIKVREELNWLQKYAAVPARN